MIEIWRKKTKRSESTGKFYCQLFPYWEFDNKHDWNSSSKQSSEFFARFHGAKLILRQYVNGCWRGVSGFTLVWRFNMSRLMSAQCFQMQPVFIFQNHSPVQNTYTSTSNEQFQYATVGVSTWHRPARSDLPKGKVW